MSTTNISAVSTSSPPTVRHAYVYSSATLLLLRPIKVRVDRKLRRLLYTCKLWSLPLRALRYPDMSRLPSADWKHMKSLTMASLIIAAAVKILTTAQQLLNLFGTCISPSVRLLPDHPSTARSPCPIPHRQRGVRACRLPLPSIILANVRSISNKMEEVTTGILNKNIHLAVLTESWLTSDTHDDFLKIKHYQTFRRDRLTGTGGGLLIYLHNSYTATVIDTELCCCQSELLSLYIHQCNLLLIAVYHPFWGSTEAHESCLDAILSIYDHCFTKIMPALHTVN